MNTPFDLWMAEYLLAGFDRAVAQRVYDALHFLDLSFGTPAEAAQAVRDCIAEVGPGGGHFLQTDSGEFMPDVPLANGLAYFEAARSLLAN